MEQVKQDIIVTLHEFDEDGFNESIFERKVITFENAIGYQLGSGFIGVQGADGNFTIYPSDRIHQVSIIIKE